MAAAQHDTRTIAGSLEFCWPTACFSRRMLGPSAHSPRSPVSALVGVATALSLAACSTNYASQGDDATCDTGPLVIECGVALPPDTGLIQVDAGDGTPCRGAETGAACTREGLVCSSGSGPCTFGRSCQCSGGMWRCSEAHPDPVCVCGRQPSEGDPCVNDGAQCGSCCPSAGTPAFGPFSCVAGRWRTAGCPDLVCPPPAVVACGPDRAAMLGGGCDVEGALCGDICCDAAECREGVWVDGPSVRCACLPERSYDCGSGTCLNSTACVPDCGPTDGIEHRCDELPADCTSCDCAPSRPNYRCDDSDGHVRYSMLFGCG